MKFVCEKGEKETNSRRIYSNFQNKAKSLWKNLTTDKAKTRSNYSNADDSGFQYATGFCSQVSQTKNDTILLAKEFVVLVSDVPMMLHRRFMIKAGYWMRWWLSDYRLSFHGKLTSCYKVTIYEIHINSYFFLETNPWFSCWSNWNPNFKFSSCNLHFQRELSCIA